MVLDTSAIVAILLNEPERERFIGQIERAPIRRISVANRVAATLVIEGRKRDAGRADLDLFLHEAEVEIVPVTLELAEFACEAFRRYGRGRHPGGLKFGDVFSHALGGLMRPSPSPRGGGGGGWARCSRWAGRGPGR